MSDVLVGVERWEHIKELLYQAMQLAAQERKRFLDEACGSDAALRAEVESLLTAEADVRSGKISIGSPLARALVGKKMGVSVEVNTPKGPKAYEIANVAWN